MKDELLQPISTNPEPASPEPTAPPSLEPKRPTFTVSGRPEDAKYLLDRLRREIKERHGGEA